MSEHITRISMAEAADGDRTDWARIRDLSDSAIDSAIAGDCDTFAIDLRKATAVRYAIYRDSAGQWRWRLMGSSGEILARSGGAFSSKAAASAAVAVVRTALAQAQAA